MKKVSFLMLVVLLTAGCARGYYAPHNVNQFGTQTQVVLGQANFRIVRNLEVVIDINNTNLKRADVEKSAYAELLRRANLTGSQALINVVIEEVRRESSNIFRVLFSGIPKVTQHVAARATIIEFLDETGNPIPSVVSNFGTAPRYDNQENSKQNNETVSQVKAQEPNSLIVITFKDKQFMKACIENCDYNSDKKLTKDEVLSTTGLYISNYSIQDMKGIELFENLEVLEARNNLFKEIDLTQNTKLVEIKLNSKPLKNIYLKKGQQVKCDVPSLIQRL